MMKRPQTAKYLNEVSKDVKEFVEEFDPSLKRELERCIEQLEEAIKHKDLFTDIIRHDLLNPLNIIEIASGELPDSSEVLKLKDMIKRNVQKAIGIIENASKLAKLESLEKLEYESKDLNPIFKKVVEDFDPLLKEKRMKLNYMADGEYYAHVNPSIEHVFSNLISNAIKYSPEESEITCGIEDRNGSWGIYVKDHGSGVDDEYKTKIFERFSRIEKGGVKGSGLGLSIVKRVVELHKGRVGVEDNPEGGSIFYVELPKIQSKINEYKKHF